MGTANLALRFPANATVSQVSRSGSAVTLAAPNLARRGLNIANESSVMMFVKLGALATGSDFTVKLPPRANYELPFPDYTGLVTGVWATAGAGFAAVTEMS